MKPKSFSARLFKLGVPKPGCFKSWPWPSFSWFLGFPWLILSMEFPWLFWHFLKNLFQGFCGFGGARKSLVNLRLFLAKTEKWRNGRTGGCFQFLLAFALFCALLRTCVFLRAQRLKKLKISLRDWNFSSGMGNFKRATHQGLIFYCGEFWRSRLKFSSEIEVFNRDRTFHSTRHDTVHPYSRRTRLLLKRQSTSERVQRERQRRNEARLNISSEIDFFQSLGPLVAH